MGDLIPSGMTDVTAWAIIVGFFSPVVLNFIIAKKWETHWKTIAAFAWSAIVGTITAIIGGAYEGLGIPSAILLTLVVSITAYKNFWEKVGLTNRGKEDVT